MRILAAFPLSFCALMVGAAPAFAQCVEPPQPPLVNGNSATEDQMRNVMSDARGYITQAEMFQACVTQELADARAQATIEGHPLDPAIEMAAKARLAASQKAQDRVGQASNATLNAYKLAHAQ